jgi:hypothetical protein
MTQPPFATYWTPLLINLLRLHAIKFKFYHYSHWGKWRDIAPCYAHATVGESKRRCTFYTKNAVTCILQSSGLLLYGWGVAEQLTAEH